MSFSRTRQLLVTAAFFGLFIAVSSTASAQWPVRGGIVNGNGFGSYAPYTVYARPYYSYRYDRYPRYYRTPVYVPPTYGRSGYGLPNGVGPRPVVMNPGFIGY